MPTMAMIQLSRISHVISACRPATPTIVRYGYKTPTAAMTSSCLRRLTSGMQSRIFRDAVTSSVSSATGMTLCRWVHGHVPSLGTEPSAIGISDYDHERQTFKLNRPEFFNFAEDVIDFWAHKEQVSFCIFGSY